MEQALKEARSALQEDEVPIGAALVKNNKLIFSSHNLTNQTSDPTAHAEKLILDKAHKSGLKFLYDYTLYVTIEPCIMCSGMLIWSRLGRLVFGAYDLKAGAVGSVYNVIRDKNLNHSPELKSGILAEECKDLMKRFFQSKRNRK
ncbi:MAG: hypothetical protein APR54_09075 [Candidatus Cloacimonas sp. SDB]|nr:MAG: hypothetical protein APR54_09075 [Candidatus Cloacimonas sp. SDB]